ncbi:MULTISPECIES: histidine--tRNA ligase [unclassified Spirosoma]|uniref:histidine--tRNA ligase n=1 Tax=unclassified Spirosoma TaxID=2621999 RepID=UPI00095F96C3|nr:MULTISPECIES: histidine--tRNA ligase [unclassified Spirosoma]MBN8826541.1 histidine--tRNA ligase [Spirosoma sp.]OJW71604.1 MAG: histidine--tRNA ligase [Spirosoma sp. 48-14]
MQKPTLPKGTRDFGPEQMSKRLFIFDTIRQTFKRFGFLPLETPAMENLSTLTGKYGDEGDQLLFKILNSGDFAANLTELDISSGYKKLTPKIAEKGLRYDLTVPFARYVVMNRNALAMPFKRYQMQPVWRADRPQKGRYREFYQCDADVVGTDSLICEAEIVLMIHEVFRNLGIQQFTLKINNRKILAGIAEAIGVPGQESTLSVAIDKLDKIGQEKVLDELRERGFSEDTITNLLPLFSFTELDIRQTLEQLKNWLAVSETAQKGIAELEETLQLVGVYGLLNSQIELDPTLARGLSYYTGAIFEVKANGVSIGSVSGGGRYDNLTGAFGMPGLSGVGISFGVDRIYDVMEELNLFPASTVQGTQVLIVPFDAEARRVALPLLSQLRVSDIAAEVYPDLAKIKKMLDYANAKSIPFVVLIGSEEVQTGLLTLKNMVTGEQRKVSVEEISNLIV